MIYNKHIRILRQFVGNYFSDAVGAMCEMQQNIFARSFDSP